MDNYEKLLERISRSSGLEKEEIERKVEAKKAKLSGLISREGAAQIVAAELGINFEQETLKISELVEGMKRANVFGKVIKLNPIRAYNKNGREGKVASLLLADQSANIRAVLWDTNHISLLEKGDIKEGTVIEISNGNVRNNELHLSSFSDIKISKKELGDVIETPIFSEKKLIDAKVGDNVRIRAVIVNVFEPRYFEICPQCNRRVFEGQCETHGKVSALRRALLNIILDDGSETIRSVVFGEQIKNLGLKDEEIFSLEEYNKAKGGLIGEEKNFFGQMRNNMVLNTLEFSIQQIEEINPNELIKELEAKGVAN